MTRVTRLTVEERAEVQFKEITRAAARWREIESIMGARRDDADVIAVLVSGDIRRLLDRAQRGDRTYWQDLQRAVQVPIIPFFGFQGDEWSPLLEGQARELYDVLAAHGWSPDRGQPRG